MCSIQFYQKIIENVYFDNYNPYTTDIRPTNVRPTGVRPTGVCPTDVCLIGVGQKYENCMPP